MAPLKSARAEFKIFLVSKVKIMRNCLEREDQTEEYILKGLQECEQILTSLKNGETTIDYKESQNIVIVKSQLNKAVEVGYTKVPVVIAYNPQLNPDNTWATATKIYHPSISWKEHF